MMSKWIWVFFFSCVIFGMWLIYDQGIQPKAIRVLKPSYFMTSEELGDLAYKALRPRLALRPLVYIGKQPGSVEHDRIFEGFLRAAQTEVKPFEHLILLSTQKDLRLPAGLKVTDLQGGGPELEAVILSAIQKGGRVAVYGSTLDLVHFQPGNRVKSFQGDVFRNALTVGMVELPGLRARTPLETCDRPDPKKYLHTLGCLIEAKDLWLKTKKGVKWDKVVGVIDQEGERDFVLYTYDSTLAD